MDTAVSAKNRSPDTTREGLLRELGVHLRDLFQGMDKVVDCAAKTQQLHPTDFACIGLLQGSAEPLSPRQVIAHLGLTSGSGTALLDRLEVAGYVSRIPNPDDRRSVLISLDREKAAAPIKLFRKIEDSFRRATDGFDEAQLMIVIRFLGAFVQATEELGHECSGQVQPLEACQDRSAFKVRVAG